MSGLAGGGGLPRPQDVPPASTRAVRSAPRTRVTDTCNALAPLADAEFDADLFICPPRIHDSDSLGPGLPWPSRSYRLITDTRVAFSPSIRSGGSPPTWQLQTQHRLLKPA